MNKKTRLSLTDTPVTTIMKMSDGNPGACVVMTNLLSNGGNIDPQDFMGGLGNLLSLDSHGIYGSDIWGLFKYVCGEDLTKMVATLRAVQLGIIPEEDLLRAIKAINYTNDDNFKLDVNDLHIKVCEQLEQFEKPVKN